MVKCSGNSINFSPAVRDMKLIFAVVISALGTTVTLRTDILLDENSGYSTRVRGQRQENKPSQASSARP
ncbi:unnamed protein product [Arctogadus glacialis]